MGILSYAYSLSISRRPTQETRFQACPWDSLLIRLFEVESAHCGRHYSLGWDPGLHSKDKVSWTQAFLTVDLMRSAAWELTVLTFLSLWAIVLNCELKSTLSPWSCFCQTVLSQKQEESTRQWHLQQDHPRRDVSRDGIFAVDKLGRDWPPFQSLNKMFSTYLDLP